MTRKDWIVKQIILSAEAKKYGESKVHYPYHIRGHYSQECDGENLTFAWQVPRNFADNPRYDLSELEVDERGVKV